MHTVFDKRFEITRSHLERLGLWDEAKKVAGVNEQAFYVSFMEGSRFGQKVLHAINENKNRSVAFVG